MYASKHKLLAVLLGAFLLAAMPVMAAEKKNDPAREQARRLQQANRKLEQDKAQLAKEKTEAEDKLKAAEDKLGSAQRKAASASQRVADLSKDLETQRSEKEKLAAQLAETSDKLRKEESERQRLETLAAQQKQSITQCEGLNAKLHDEGVALLDRYQKKGCFDAALQHEPFTGIKQVEIENFVEDSRDKLDQLKIDPLKTDQLTIDAQTRR